MSGIYTGDPAQAADALAATIAGATNATPIVVATTTPHNFGTKDLVAIYGVLGNTAANRAATNPWSITVVDPTHFALDGSVGSGAYTSGGTAVDLSLTPQFQIPSDGDGPGIKAADVNPGFEAIGDRLQLLSQRRIHLASLAALTAIAAPHEGMIRDVAGFGRYIFLKTATSGISPFRLAADDVTAGGWLSDTAHETTSTKRISAAVFRYYEDSTNYDVALGAGVPATGTEGLWDPSGLYLQVQQLSGTNAPHFSAPIDEFLIHGATLQSATIGFHPTGGHGALPAKQPGLAIVRVAQTGYNVAPTKLLSAPASGFAILAAANVAAYEAAQSLVFTADQNNVIDLASFTYYAIFADESGANARAGNNLQRLALTMSAIPDARRG